MAENDGAPQWREGIYDVFKDIGIAQVVYVPDAGHARLIDMCEEDPDIACGPLTNEFEGIGMCVGAWLGGQRAAMLMQSSGVGNVINALGLVSSARAPFFTVITMRGEWGEFNPWQLPMGQGTGDVLRDMGVIVNRAERPEDVVDVVRYSALLAFQSYAPVAAVISQRVTGAKVFK